MNSARLSKSERLQRVFNYMLDGNEHTTLDIVQNAGVCAVNSAVDELRDNGLQIDCNRRGDKWYYRMHVTKKVRTFKFGYR